MPKYEVFVSKSAEKDLKGLSEYISFNLLEPNIANQFVSKIDKAILSLEDYPYRCPLVQEEIIREIGIRKLIVNGCILFFKINEEKKQVGILRIIIGNRNCQKMI